jgi:hypothetical protein
VMNILIAILKTARLFRPHGHFAGLFWLFIRSDHVNRLRHAEPYPICVALSLTDKESTISLSVRIADECNRRVLQFVKRLLFFR